MIVGIGVDNVDIARFSGQLRRTPSLKQRLFVGVERDLADASLAARFAAKEALIKALGGSGELSWQDLEVIRTESRAPAFRRTEKLERELSRRGGGRIHVSMTHDAGVATAFVIIDGVPGGVAGDPQL